MLARHFEGGHVAGEAQEEGASQLGFGVHVTAAHTDHRPLRQKFVPLGEVQLGRARQPDHGELIVLRVNEQSDQQIERVVLAPDGVFIPNFQAVKIGSFPVGPGRARMEGVGQDR